MTMSQATGIQRLEAAVVDELRWNRSLSAERITVEVTGSLVVLRGVVRTYVDRCRAEEIVKSIRGVGSVRNEIEVHVTVGEYRTDRTLERLAAEILESLALLPDARPRASVADGWVTLEGVVDRPCLTRFAEDAIRGIAGVRGITNRLQVEPRANATDVAAELEAALRRRAIGERVTVKTAQGRVALHGVVRSCSERDALLDLARSAAGAEAIDDHITVE